MKLQATKQRTLASVVPFPLCFLNKHLPNRRAAKWDGYNYVTSCRHCGAKLRRKSSKDWRPDWLEAA
ncbi:MAG: hypothetical protein R3D89_14470 [Sphingomonadaceae bacterium]